MSRSRSGSRRSASPRRGRSGSSRSASRHRRRRRRSGSRSPRSRSHSRRRSVSNRRSRSPKRRSRSPPRRRNRRTDPQGKDSDGTKVYIGNLSSRAHERDLEDIFHRFGTIKDIYIPRDKRTWLGRGFGFVTFENTASAQEASEDWDGRRFMGRRIAVNLARPRPEARGGSPARVKTYVPSRDDSAGRSPPRD
eukprot:UN29370